MNKELSMFLSQSIRQLSDKTNLIHLTHSQKETAHQSGELFSVGVQQNHSDNSE
jgi:hypothetical protein